MSGKSDSRSQIAIRLACIAALVGVFGWLSRHDDIDDALIYARFIGNALRGIGLVFNPGEHINALSSPFYSYAVLGMARLLHGNVILGSAVVSSLFFLGACWLAEIIVPWAGLVLASTAYFYNLVGMETTVFLFMLLLTTWLVVREKYDWLPTLCVLLVLTRFEGAALLVPCVVELYRRRKMPRLVSFLPAAGIILAYLALNHRWYGAYLPASAGAKLGQGRSQYWGRWPTSFFHSAYQLKPEFLPILYVVILVAIFLIPGVRKFGNSAFNRIVLPFLAMLLGFYVLFNIPGYKWYFAPFIFFAMIYACSMIPSTGWVRWGVAAIVLLSAATDMRLFYVVNSSKTVVGYIQVGRWLTANTPPGTTLEAMEIGTVGWYCRDCVIIDILGLTQPKNAQHIAKRDAVSWLAEDHPDFVVAHDGDFVFERVAKQSPLYQRVNVDFGPGVYLLRRNPATPSQ